MNVQVPVPHNIRNTCSIRPHTWFPLKFTILIETVDATITLKRRPRRLFHTYSKNHNRFEYNEFFIPVDQLKILFIEDK